MKTYYIIIPIVAVFLLGIGFLFFLKIKKIKVSMEEREKEMKRKMYELSILKELGDRIGYSLNMQNIVDVITGSLRQFIDYSAVSYMFLKPEEIIFKIHLEKSVSRKFIDDIKERMLKSLAALLEENMAEKRIEEVLSGAILIEDLVEDLSEPVKSFFNIPLVIASKVVGVLTIADTKPGLYKEKDMTILYKITQQASQAVTKLQEVVETEQRKLNSMVESMEDGVVMTDKDYRVMVVNPAAKYMFRLVKDDVTIFDFIDNLKDKFDIRSKLEESLKLDKSTTSEDVLVQDRFLQISVLPVKSKSGEDILGGVVVFHDITKEKELEKMREDFTSMIAHELRSPLDSIKKMAEVMQLKIVKKKDRDEYIKMMYSNSSNMLFLVSNLLDMAKMEAGKFEILERPDNIKNVIKERIGFFEIQAQDKKIKLFSKLGEDVPEKINFDSFRIGQVLNNFISNALKFTNENGEIEVQAIYHKKGSDINQEAEKAGIKWFLKTIDLPDSLVVAVTDMGQGISEQDIPKLFKKFQQIKSEQRKGTGLGLVIAKGIIEAHNGIIGVNSREGTGSTFYFTIPAIGAQNLL